MKVKNSTRIVGVLAFVLALGIIVGCSSPTDLEQMGLKGKVKSYIENFFEPDQKFGVWEAGDPSYPASIKRHFNKKGQWLEMSYIFMGSSTDETVIATYEDGKIVGSNSYDSKGKLKSTYKIKQKTRNVIESEGFTDEEKNYCSYATLKKGKFVKDSSEYRNSDGKTSINVNTFEYDKKGNLVLQIHKYKAPDKDVEITRYKYEYLEFDKKDNWKKRLQYKNDEKHPVQLTIREIEYY